MSDETPIVTPLANGRFLVTQGDQRLLAHAAVSGRHTWVSIGPHTFVIDRSRPAGGGRLATHDDAVALASPMPATVTSLSVAVGDQVKAGDVLVVLEAMKMELPIKAPRDGRVKAIACRTGELVQPGIPLLELE